MRRNTHGLLAGRRVDHQQSLLWLQKSFELLKFFDQRDVDFLAASGIEDVDVTARFLVPSQGRGRGPLNIFLTRVRLEDWNIGLFSERRELLDRGRPLQIERDQIRTAALFLE